MKCVVPLAGPDILDPEKGFKPLTEISGDTLIHRTLAGRPWAWTLASTDYIFVTRGDLCTTELEDYLRAKWYGCRIVTIPGITDGAMLSALAGILMVPDDVPVIVDLADIIFDAPNLQTIAFSKKLGAIIPSFKSQEIIYSYLVIENGKVTKAAEKQVISDNASAGVYIFRDRQSYVAAAAHSIANREEMRFKSTYFVCPMANGLIEAGYYVISPSVENVVSISKDFIVGPRA
jgi:hypothetical protein